MPGAGRLGVVVLNWNGLEYLKPCLASVLASDHDDFVLVVADNASTDGSAQWVADHVPQAVLVRNATNLRFAAGNNAGARAALEHGAQTVVLLNNDTTIEPQLLRALSSALDENPRWGVVGPRICYAGRPEVIWYGGGLLDLRSGVPHHRALRKSVEAGLDPAGETDWVTGCTLAARREVWEALGGLDDSFYMYGEDVDFCLRARAVGWQVGYTPAARVLHAVSASIGGHETPFKAYHKVRARRRLIRRHATPGQRTLAWMGMVGHDVAWMLWLLLRGAPRAAGAVLEGWIDDPEKLPRHRVGTPAAEGPGGGGPT